MKQTARWLLGALIGGSLLTGCAHNATPQRETNVTRAAKGMQAYGAYPNHMLGTNPHVVQDTRNMQTGLTTRSAHALAYELEYQNYVKGAAVLVVGRNAFIGVTPPPGGTVTPGQVRALQEKATFLDKTLRHVYVTTEPGTVKYLSDYTDALERGLPVDKYQAQLHSVVAKTWPPSP
ncbi:MAG: YhcN/YlaJ family sporulation lipoprotein [Tumebacillaceae bacterium]